MGLEGNYIFCVKKEHEEKFKIIDHLQKIKPNSKVITIDYQTADGNVKIPEVLLKYLNNQTTLT